MCYQRSTNNTLLCRASRRPRSGSSPGPSSATLSCPADWSPGCCSSCGRERWGLVLLYCSTVSAVQVLLLCEVIPIPHFSITEQVLNPQQDKFILKGNPESPV